ncbi:MAG TPA: hypothetical protein DEB32_02770 [Stenotrophomonas sp.]|nr:hypothetical protein [Stenotrophomonas sp.]
MPLPSRLLMAERDLRDLADQIQNIGVRHPEVGPGFVQQMTADQFRDHVVNSAAKGELYLWGVKLVIDDATLEIRCEGATRGVKEYRGDQHAGVDNSVQAAQGCRVAAGVSDGADLCTLGTADSPVHMKAADKERAYRETMQAIKTGTDLRALALRLHQEIGYPYRKLMAGILWLAQQPVPKAKPRCRYDWYLKRWVEGDTIDAVAIGGALHGQRVAIHRSAPDFAFRNKRGSLVRYVRQDYTHSIPYPQRYTALIEEGSRLPPPYEVRDLAHRAGVIRWAGQQEMERISCLATGVPHG